MTLQIKSIVNSNKLRTAETFVKNVCCSIIHKTEIRYLHLYPRNIKHSVDNKVVMCFERV